jgi:hypothetical protein
MVVNTAPEEITLTRADMPAGLELAAERSDGPDYVALYLRPSAVDPGVSGGNRLLSVLTNVGVYTTTAAAEQVYLEASGDPNQRPLEDLASVNDAATNISIEPFEGETLGADASEAYRVSYELMERHIYEYGYRFRLGNVLSYIVVGALGDPDEPAHLLEDARDLVQRQAQHITGAAAPAASQWGPDQREKIKNSRP